MASRRRLRVLFTAFGTAFAITIALGVPLAYFLSAYSVVQHELLFAARIKANRLARYIYTHEQLWQYQTVRLSALIEVPESDESGTRQKIFDVSGKEVMETGVTPAFPLLTARTPIIVSGAIVGSVETATSLHDTLVQTAIVALFSGLLGCALFFFIRLLPLRVIERAWGDLQSAQLRYQMLFDANPFPMAVVDRKTLKFLAVNEKAVETYGWSRDELMRMNTNDFYLPEDLAAAVVIARRGYVGGDTHAIPTVRHRRKDGSIIEVDMTVRAIEFSGHKATLVTVFDATERNRTMKEVRASEVRYRELVDSLPVGVVETTATGSIVSANPAWRRIFGFTEAEDLSAVDTRQLYAEPVDRQAGMDGATTKQMELGYETVFKKRDGSPFSVERFTGVVRSEDGEVVGLRGIVIDISSRKALEAQLSQAQKMEAVGQLTGGVAHDFNNILTIILANADALQEEENFAPALSARVDEIAGAVQRAADLTRQLLTFSRKQPMHPQVTDVNELVVGTGKLLRRSLGAQVRIEMSLSVGVWPVNVDRSQLETALVNLCLNARDSMPRGGKLTVKTFNVTIGDEGSAVRKVGLDDGEYAVLSVTDTGTGMSPEVLAKVFDPFFTTKEVGQGTGLGLSMVYGFSKQSNGHIEAESAVGRGTSFRLYLPRTRRVAERETGNSKAALPRGSERILVVEDEEAVRQGVVKQLKGLGYDVAQAADAHAGLAAFGMASSPFDLLLTDIVMPGNMNGKGLADEVRRRWPATKIVFMSGYAENEVVHQGNIDANVLLLGKPFRSRELAQIVREALGDRTLALAD